MASEQARAYDEELRQFRDKAQTREPRPTIEQLRAEDNFEHTSEPDGVEYVPVDVHGVPGLWVTPAGADPDRVILYLHGGGYVLCSVATHRRMIGHLAKASGCHSLAIDYRLAPEHRHPAAVDDALTAYRFLLDAGYAPAHIAVSGDSAGGGLTMALLVAAKAAGLPQPGAAAVLSPWVDLEGIGESMTTRADLDLGVSRAVVQFMAAQYLGDQDRRQPTAAPLYADLAGLPPLYIQVGDHETLLDDSTRLAAAARAAGVDVTLDVVPEMQHVFQITVGYLPEADDAIRRLGVFVHDRLA